MSGPECLQPDWREQISEELERLGGEEKAASANRDWERFESLGLQIEKLMTSADKALALALAQEWWARMGQSDLDIYPERPETIADFSIATGERLDQFFSRRY